MRKLIVVGIFIAGISACNVDVKVDGEDVSVPSFLTNGVRTVLSVGGNAFTAFNESEAWFTVTRFFDHFWRDVKPFLQEEIGEFLQEGSDEIIEQFTNNRFYSEGDYDYEYED